MSGLFARLRSGSTSGDKAKTKSGNTSDTPTIDAMLRGKTRRRWDPRPEEAELQPNLNQHQVGSLIQMEAEINSLRAENQELRSRMSDMQMEMGNSTRELRSIVAENAALKMQLGGDPSSSLVALQAKLDAALAELEQAKQDRAEILAASEDAALWEREAQKAKAAEARLTEFLSARAESRVSFAPATNADDEYLRRLHRTGLLQKAQSLHEMSLQEGSGAEADSKRLAASPGPPPPPSETPPAEPSDDFDHNTLFFESHGATKVLPPHLASVARQSMRPGLDLSLPAGAENAPEPPEPSRKGTINGLDHRLFDELHDTLDSVEHHPDDSSSVLSPSANLAALRNKRKSAAFIFGDLHAPALHDDTPTSSSTDLSVGSEAQSDDSDNSDAGEFDPDSPTGPEIQTTAPTPPVAQRGSDAKPPPAEAFPSKSSLSPPSEAPSSPPPNKAPPPLEKQDSTPWWRPRRMGSSPSLLETIVSAISPSSGGGSKDEPKGAGDTAGGGVPAAPPAPGVPAPPPVPGAPAVPGSGGAKKPRKKLRKLHWVPVPKHQVGRTVWSKFGKADQERLPIDWDDLETQYTVKEVSKKIAGISDRIKSESKIKRLLDIRRSNNIAIVLRRFPIPLEEIPAAIMSVDTLKLGVYEISVISKVLIPNEDEIRAVLDYSGPRDAEHLAEPERLMYLLLDVPRLRQRVRAIQVLLEWKAKISEITVAISAIAETCRELMISSQFLRLLEVILVVGNHLNGTSTEGYRMDTLTKIQDVKTGDRSANLLHFIAATIWDKMPETIDVLRDLRSMPFATQVDSAAIAEELNSLRSAVQVLGTELSDRSYDNDNKEDRFLAVLGPFHEMAKTKIAQLSAAHESMTTIFYKCASFFGETRYETLRPEVWFSGINQFLVDFRATLKELKRKRRKAEKKAAAKAAKARKAGSGSLKGTAVPVGFSSPGMMSPRTNSVGGVKSSLADFSRRKTLARDRFEKLFGVVSLAFHHTEAKKAARGHSTGRISSKKRITPGRLRAPSNMPDLSSAGDLAGTSPKPDPIATPDVPTFPTPDPDPATIPPELVSSKPTSGDDDVIVIPAKSFPLAKSPPPAAKPAAKSPKEASATLHGRSNSTDNISKLISKFASKESAGPPPRPRPSVSSSTDSSQSRPAFLPASHSSTVTDSTAKAPAARPPPPRGSTTKKTLGQSGVL